jgi:hypothetical protein
VSALGWELVRALDADNPVAGDIRVVGRRFARLSSSAASIAQACTVELRWFLGEWSFDTRRGVPYFEQLLKDGVGPQTIRVVLDRILRRVAGVRRMASADIAIDHVTRVGSVRNVVVDLANGATVPVGTDPFPVGGR